MTKPKVEGPLHSVTHNVDTERQEELGQAGEVRVRGRTFSVEETARANVWRCERTLVGLGSASNALWPEHRMG